jgi:pre-mRNA-splicing factor CWC26
MPSDLHSYVATHYLVADPKPVPKKRKRKHGTDAAGLLINDEDETGWGLAGDQNNDGGDDVPVMVSGTSAEFRKTKKSTWKVVGGATKASTADDGDSAAADAILSSAVAETEAARHVDDELPVIEEVLDIEKNGKDVALRSMKQRQEKSKHNRKGEGEGEEETVYRDATGRRIDVTMRRAEARRAAAEAETRERRAKESLQGEVQVEAARRRREELEDAAQLPLARTADDVELNQELKEKQRWNDPMMQFMTERDVDKRQRKTSKGRPVYTGTASPNRYGIKPGYRWDGVDRSNGFEAERFKALNRKERNKNLEYAWQMDE